VAELTRAPAPAIAPDVTPTPEAAPADAITPPTANVGDAAATPAAVQDAASAADGGKPEPPPAPAEPRSVEANAAPEADQQEKAAPAMSAVAGNCAAAPTPADRTICGDPELRRLQHELQRAYARALDAHEDRSLLRERELAWRDARNTISDPHRLAELYEARIQKLNAATADALRRQ
jgi:hypothetical protein